VNRTRLLVEERERVTQATDSYLIPGFLFRKRHACISTTLAQHSPSMLQSEKHFERKGRKYNDKTETSS
ncbi:hypothetical protein V7112_05965, partial [Bacillus sp. JJ1566]|uniref:hypothetical protein n=1 Tax=Bacillus sp. JJ1566 TaxID=3122961 RepID=UPI0030006307